MMPGIVRVTNAGAGMRHGAGGHGALLQHVQRGDAGVVLANAGVVRTPPRAEPRARTRPNSPELAPPCEADTTYIPESCCVTLVIESITITRPPDPLAISAFNVAFPLGWAGPVSAGELAAPGRFEKLGFPHLAALQGDLQAVQPRLVGHQAA